MILGSDSHTRYGALGTMGYGRRRTRACKTASGKNLRYQMSRGSRHLHDRQTGSRRRSPGRGPCYYRSSFLPMAMFKNKVMEFVGPGVDNLSADFRIGVDVMTTETTCLSSIWKNRQRYSGFLHDPWQKSGL